MKYESYKRTPVDDMLAGKQSKYALAIAIAKRARILTDNMQIERERVCDKPVLVAAKEFEDHKFIILEPKVND